MSARQSEHVVFLHGIAMTGIEMSLLRHRVAGHGYVTHSFHYHSFQQTPAQHARRLQFFLETLDAEVLHLVAHSMGGIVLCHLYDQFPDQRPGRVVMLGTPLSGSVTAQAFYGFGPTRFLVARGCEQGLLGDHPGWQGRAEAGMIAGTRGIGLGALLISDLPEPNDGAVSLDETRCDRLKDHLQLSHSHMGMLLANDVAEQTVQFLRYGFFARPDSH